MTQLDMARKIEPGARVLDVGSGHGGGSHALAKRFGCKVLGYNIGPGQNARNLARAKELGLESLVDAVVGDINHPFPADWTNTFDGVRAYDFVSQEIRAAEDPEFETFYTKNILLNEGLRAWMAPADQPHENFVFPEEVLPRGNAL